MKKQLLAFVGLITIANGINAMEKEKEFSYETYGFNVPTQDLAIGETFGITDIDPEVYVPANLTDATGKIWALKIGRSGNSALYTVIAIPSEAPLATEISAKKPLKVLEIIPIYEQIEIAIKNNDVPEINKNVQKLPAGPISPDIQKLLEYSDLKDAVEKALAGASPKTQIAFAKAMLKQTTLSISEKEILQHILLKLVEEPENLPALKWLLEQEMVKDYTGKALEKAIKSGFYDIVQLLVLNRAKITDEAQLEAAIKAYNGDDRYLKLLKKQMEEEKIKRQLERLPKQTELEKILEQLPLFQRKK